MASQDWPDSREQLLKDIETFSVNGPPGSPSSDEPAPAQRFTPAAQPVTPAQVAPVAKFASAVPIAETGAVAPAPSSLLAALKKQAIAKLEGEEKKTSLQGEQLKKISDALQRAFVYLNELSPQLNVVKPPYEKAYSFFGVVDFDGMNWEEGRADYRMQQVSTEDRIYDQVTMRYRLVAPKKFTVTRENPAQEKLRKALFDHNIAFTADEEKNDRARVERATFNFPCEVKAGLLIVGDTQTGGLVLKTRNIERFGIMEFRMAPEAITHESLDELAMLILGKPSRIAQLFQRIS